MTEIPITNHSRLPDEVPLVADFNDDRNRLSYYYPIVREIDGIRTPITEFFPVIGSMQTYPDIEYREITRFMQDIDTRQAFVRGDFASGKYEEDTGSRIESQDPYDIEGTVLEMLKQLGRGKQHLGGRIAVREWVPHEVEFRYFIRGGRVLYGQSTVEGFDGDLPVREVHLVAERFDTFAWSVDFIRHKKNEAWYLTDMGLDGLYHDGSSWVAISEHPDSSYSPEKHKHEMPPPRLFKFRR